MNAFFKRAGPEGGGTKSRKWFDAWIPLVKNSGLKITTLKIIYRWLLVNFARAPTNNMEIFNALIEVASLMDSAPKQMA